MADTPTQTGHYISVSTPLGTDKLILRGFSGEESISDLFHFNLDMLSTESNLDFSKIVGESATVTVTSGGTSKRYFNGVITRFVQAGTSDDKTVYHAEMKPKIALMSLSADCRIFQNETAPKILETMFKDMGCTDFRSDVKSTYDAREYCVQYRETALDFVFRLMEEEGIVFYFEHTSSKHTMVLSDDTGSHDAYPDMPSAGVRMIASDSSRPDEHSIHDCTVEQQVTAESFKLDDYNFEKPTLELKVEHGTKKLSTTLYDYPGSFDNKSRGDFLVRRRIEAVEARGKILNGEAFTPKLSAGYKLKLTDHVRSDVNDDWLLLSVSHHASLSEYTNNFTAIPLSVPYRAPMRTPRPTIPGTQTAEVVGKSGEEIWTDKYGRIMVQFHWDQLGKKDEKSSCWIRVSQAWAGKTWGAFFLPRIGQEVIVSFLEGNPDCPLVTGAVYNATQTVPYALPGNQTRSTIKTDSSKGSGGSNELRFEDKKGSEEIYIHAQKDMNLLIEDNRDAVLTEGNDTLTVKKGNREATITEGNDTLTVSKGNRKTTVSKGDDTLSVSKGKRTVTVKDSETHNNKADFTQNVDGDHVLKVKGNLTIKATGTVTIESGKTMTTKSGTAMTIKSGTAMTAQAGTAATVKAGTAATFQSGTAMTIKAGTSMTCKAGMSVSIKAGMSLKSEGSLNAEQKGGVASKVTGGATAAIKGAITQIG